MSLVRIPSSSIARGRRRPRTMATVRKRSYVREPPSKIATTSPESQKVQLHQGLQGAAQGDLRPVRKEVNSAFVRHGGEAHLQVHSQGAVPGRGQAVLLQGGGGGRGT